MRWSWPERVAVAVASLALAVVLIALLSGYFTGHDTGAVSGTQPVGLQFFDQGDAVLAPGQPHPRYDSDPPTSGPHVSVAVSADDRRLSDNQILSALAAGDVVIVYGTPQPPPALVAVVDSLANPFSPPLAAAGLAVILAQRPGTSGLTALSWTRMVRVGGPSDPALSEFVREWLGHGAAS